MASRAGGARPGGAAAAPGGAQGHTCGTHAHHRRRARTRTRRSCCACARTHASRPCRAPAQDTHSPRLGIAVFVYGLRLQSQSLKTGWDCSPSPRPVPQNARDYIPSPRPVPQNARDCSPSPLTLSLKIAQNRSKWLKMAKKWLKSLKMAQNCSRTSTRRFIEGPNANILLIF